MTFFDNDQILDIADRATKLGLVNRRDALLAGLHPGFLASLPNSGTPQSQIIIDLNEFNRIPSIEGGVIPFEHWLRTASFLMAVRPTEQKFFRDLADKVAHASKLSTKERPDGPAAAAIVHDTVEEKIVFVNDLIPISFLDNAKRVGQSVVRMIVPSYLGGAPRTFPMSADPLKFFGTGWLIGKKHLITNHHVIKARSPGEADPDDSDFRLQAENCTAQFDYDFENAPGVKEIGLKLSAANKALDYAVLELSAASNRDPLVLWGRPLKFSDDDYIPVNVIQHPGGSPKQMGIRNNLAARLDDTNLAYFTDTQGGSSGSPVCTDEWFVMALHKASTTGFGNIEFQGNETPWVNIGTRIDRIIKDLKDNHASLWSDIAADIHT